ncbi:alpha/beta hydrolase [Ferrovibrio sp.]|uniref:alpha/beta hydrolase n=1 Tax=Ferrovibrio sp. TaxID=1917215 RepID=UPI003D28EC8C
MLRRFVLCRLAPCLVLGLALLLTAAPSFAAETIGVLLLHGKNPGSPQNPGLQSIRTKLEADGMRVRVPDMPWSANRYIDGDWAKAMGEVKSNIDTLRSAGATKIVVLGHSIGCAGALSFAATRGGVDALVLMAPGHVPYYYYNAQQQGPNGAVRASIDEARALVAAGQGDTKRDFKDNNQGKALSVRLTAAQYLSYFDPNGEAEMGEMAKKVPAGTPSLLIIGDDDPLTTVAKSYIFDRLPPSPKSVYQTIKGTHVSVLQSSREEIATWIKQALAS